MDHDQRFKILDSGSHSAIVSDEARNQPELSGKNLARFFLTVLAKLSIFYITA
jgi:hypothetical protein